MNEIRKYMFFALLCLAAWQDIRTQSIGRLLLLSAGVSGVILCLLTVRNWNDIVLSCGIGILILWISRLSAGGIGEGDGWFFLVSGLYLNAIENMSLLLSGLFCCSLFCLPFAVKAILKRGKGRKKIVPFLPFLLPMGMVLTFVR